MCVQVPRFTLPLRPGLVAFIIICLFASPRISSSSLTNPQIPLTETHQDYRKWELPDGAIRRLGKGVLGGSDRAIAFSPDGKHLAVASGIGIWIYDVETARELTLLNGGRPTLIRSVAYTRRTGRYSPQETGNGTRFNFGRWKTRTAARSTRIPCLGFGGLRVRLDALAFSPDGRIVAWGSRDEIQFWNVENQRHLKTLQGHKGRIFSLEFSPDGKTLASGAEDDTVKLWEVATGKNFDIFEHSSDVLSVAFSPNRETLVTAASKSVKLWNISTKKNVATLKHTNHVKAVVYSLNGTTLVSGEDGGANLWDVRTRKKIVAFKHRPWAGSIAFSHDGSMLATADAGRFGLTPGTVKLWDVTTGTNIATLQGHTGTSSAVAFSPDGGTLAMRHGDGTVKLWEATTGQHISLLPIESAWSMAYSPDGNTLALGRHHGTVKLTDVKSGRRVAILRGHGGSVDTVVFSPDGTKLAVGARGGDQSSRGTVKLWGFPPTALDVVAQRSLKTFDAQTKGGIHVAFSPDSKILAVGSDDGVNLLDVETGKNIAIPQQSFSPAVAFSPDGRMLASRSPDATRLWDVSMRKTVMTLHTGSGVRARLSRFHRTARC